MFVHLLLGVAFASQISLIAGFFMNNMKNCYNGRCFGFFPNTFLLPHSPSDQKIAFKLFNKTSTTSAQLLGARDPNSVKSSKFDKSGKAAFIIHGFNDSDTAPWVAPMVEKLLTQVPNVIVVDWKKGAEGFNYFQAVANCRVVGYEIATLIKTLGVDLAKVHVIGHSLGAQIAGYAGKDFTTTKIGRITGLDPAAPLFENFDERIKLDPGDAVFVDVMHTDAEPILDGGLGTSKNAGHVDFWPNGGRDMPGCATSLIDTSNINNLLNSLGNMKWTSLCSHMKAVTYFTDSIQDENFLAYPCASRADFQKGQCTSCESGCNHMGYHATSSPSGVFYLKTD